jgi:hypothetical protein
VLASRSEHSLRGPWLLPTAAQPLRDCRYRLPGKACDTRAGHARGGLECLLCVGLAVFFGGRVDRQPGHAPEVPVVRAADVQLLAEPAVRPGGNIGRCRLHLWL